MSKIYECHECGHNRREENLYRLDVYDSPFDTLPHEIHVCKTPLPEVSKNMREYYHHSIDSCEELLTDTSWADFRYFTCEYCNRMICEQNPHNGWHVQYRIINECEQVCLSCYESMMFTDGLSDDDIESGTLHGMFFSTYDLESAGFICEGDYFASTSNDAKRILEIAKRLKSENRIVVINYERMAIGGLEGSVSLWHKQWIG